MEEPTAAQKPPPTQDPNPPTAAQTTPLPPQQEPPQPPTPPEQPASKKRPLENRNDHFQNSKYFKMRLVLKDLRPHFIEVLRTPDFRNCTAANEIKEKMKLLVELYKQMTAETVSESLPGETGMKQKPEGQPQEKQQSEDGKAPGTYIVGGSAFGWNFITFTGSKPAYYGVTKESFRSAQASLGE
ncbi:huntingtin [Durio zibethinus]|uniref:Huntingtin n=1 Tax=Durio zibethinus TaxID=66656 RepID=A0A6P6B086_DURZI|nr:huntingtin [Durio zibethinus]